MDQKEYDAVIVGAGLSGITTAYSLIHDKAFQKILILDKRNHLGGNCFDCIDQETGILYSVYGPHIFHTNSERVWKFVNLFGEWEPYHHKVFGYDDSKQDYFQLPVNLQTINFFHATNLQNKQDFEEWKLKNIENFTPSSDQNNSENAGIKRFGKVIYQSVIEPYTLKQWNIHPRNLDASVVERIPLYTDFHHNYFSDKYQALPKNGYTVWFENLVASLKDKITILLSTNFFDMDFSRIETKHLFFTGPIDEFVIKIGKKFNLYPKDLAPLKYRSLKFELERRACNSPFYQKNFIINYPSANFEFTRIAEYKHVSKSLGLKTLIVKEFPQDEGEPYYPIPNKENQDVYQEYKNIASLIQETFFEKIKLHFLGRLASYKYFNMDQAIENAFQYIENTKLE